MKNFGVISVIWEAFILCTVLEFGVISVMGEAFILCTVLELKDFQTNKSFIALYIYIIYI